MISLINLINSILPIKRFDPFGKDSLMFSVVPYFLFPALIIAGGTLLWNHAWVIMFIIYCILPLLDEIFSHDLRNPSE